ncbi:MAG: hypothetical protein J6M14_06285 [Campylobacter sp.]|nr:hypothetical protein [Campylobacter sp.]
MDNFTTLREIKCENNILTHDSILSVDLEKMGEKEKSNFLFFIGEIVKIDIVIAKILLIFAMQI